MPDLALTMIGLVTESLEQAFSPSSPLPPAGRGTSEVWFLPGDSVPLDGLAHDCGPLVWTRILRRWRTTTFPDDTPAPTGCADLPVIAIEAGIARCADTGDIHSPPDRQTLSHEATILADDSWRIDRALCRAIARATATDTISHAHIGAGEPAGPQGGVIIWTQTLTVALSPA